MPSISQLISQAFAGTPSTIEQLPTYKPGQISAFDTLLQQGMQNYDPAQLEKFATEQYHQQTVPRLSERFTASTGGRLSSPSFVSQLGESGTGLASRLAAMRSEQGLKQLQLGLTPQYEYLYKPAQPGFGEELTRGAVGTLASAVPNLAVKGAEALGNKLFGGRVDKGQVSQQLANQAAGNLGVSATEQALSGLTPSSSRAPRTAADLVAPSTGNMVADAFQSPSLTPFTRQALAKTNLQSPSPAAEALKQAGTSAAVGAAGTAAGAGIKSALGGLGGAAAAATAPAWLPAALALGVPAAIGLAGFGAVKAYDWWQDRKRRKAEKLMGNRRNV